MIVLLALFVAMALFVAVIYALLRARNIDRWILPFLRREWTGPSPAPGTTRHLMFCFVDHYEPGFERPGLEVELARVARWRRELPALCEGHVDADGRAPVHTFFFPEEEYRSEHLASLVELCRLGLGEIEVHLHHDDDTAEGLREKLRRFTRTLVDRHDALPVDADGRPQWAFIHDNWCLDNSRPDGRWCGVDNELLVLKEEGCYADFTFPSAPDVCQPPTINSIYYATDDAGRPCSHFHGTRVRVGAAPSGDLMLIQGPLGFMWHSRKFGLIPRIENADVRTTSPPSSERIDAWVRTGIHVAGRPEWIFVKVHTHGAPERDSDTLLGERMRAAFTHLESRYNDGTDWRLHYVSAREAYNIVKAAEAGRGGDPNAYRDFLIARPAYRPLREGAAA
jgi:hypothetical protein